MNNNGIEKINVGAILLGMIILVIGLMSILPKDIGDSKNKISKSKLNSNYQIKSSIKKTAWKMIDIFPINISGDSFNTKTGKNGERVNTGEMFLVELPPGKYRLSTAGSHRQRFSRGNWYPKPIPHNGIRHGGSPNKPVNSFLYGAVMLRMGDNSQLGSGVYTFTAPTKVYAELNIGRKLIEYKDSKGSKLNCDLSLTVERKV